MYEAFYGFREKPFSLLPDPDFLFFGRKHRLAYTMLEYGLVNQAGFTVLTGEIGSGKTTLIRRLLGELPANITVGLVSNTHRGFDELLQWTLLSCGLDYRNLSKLERYHALAHLIEQRYAEGRRTVLIIDEAQNLGGEALDELRMLSNINADKEQPLQVMLVGQPGLRQTLRRPQLQQFAQRVAVDHHLMPLGLEETWHYVRYRLEAAGGNPNLFDTKACAAIYYYARGIPRLINVLCDTALVYGFGEQRQRIDASVLCEVARDRLNGGIFPLRGRRERPPAGVQAMPDQRPQSYTRDGASVGRWHSASRHPGELGA
jgi:general secretion pathway protein A